MLAYFGRNYHSTAIGVRLVEVSCDQCGARYFFELARIGSGAATAPYAIGTASAERSAKNRAQRDRDRRLEEEAELVPCPKCLWINEDLVARYRRGRYRGATKTATGIGFAGISLTLITAWVASLGPAPAGRATIVSILTNGITISIGISGFILLVRHFLRQRIQPNRDYPLPPRLPHGSPTALVPNSETGELEAAPLAPNPGDGNGGWMDYQIGRSASSSVCCECLEPASPRFAFQRPLGMTFHLVVPLCKRCARRWTRRKWLGGMVALGAAAAFGIPLLFVLKLDDVVFWFTVCSLGALFPTVGAMIASWRAAPVRVKSFDQSRGVVRLWFRNEAYLNDQRPDG
jgi:hypothetical protein